MCVAQIMQHSRELKSISMTSLLTLYLLLNGMEPA
nr:MAG TPA: hypothetical protein [Bacteriophage sp.]